MHIEMKTFLPYVLQISKGTQSFLVSEASRKMLDGKVCHVRGLLDYKASLGIRCIQLGWTKLVYVTDKLRGERRIRAGISAVTFRDTVLNTNFNILKKICCSLVTKSCLTLCNPMDYSPRLLCPWDFPGENTGVGCHFLFQGIFSNQGWNSHLLLGRWIVYN